jgi:zinc/manganese transport system permease protein
MNSLLLFDSMFHLPFLVGLLLAPAVALLGAYLRLREEWLAALAYAQLAAAGGMVSVLLPIPVIPAALVVAGLAAAGKGALQRAGNDHYAFLIVLGWSSALLVAANSPHGEMIGKALMDGQLYFVSRQHLVAGIVLLLAMAALLPRLSPQLLLFQLFPDYFTANKLRGWRIHLPFDMLVVAAVAISVTAMGVMAAFALVFIPSWVAFRLASGWRSVLVIASVLALVAYLLAFVTAILLDQPFGPALTGWLLLLSLARFLGPGSGSPNGKSMRQ